jgi:hypothetical protein
MPASKKQLNQAVAKLLYLDYGYNEANQMRGEYEQIA